MKSELLTFLANIGLVFIGIKYLVDLLAVSPAAQRHQDRVRSWLERWQAALAKSSPDILLTMPLSALARMYERALGPRPFSGQAFRRTCLVGSSLLGAMLGFVGLICGKPFAMNMLPWDSFFASTDFLNTLAASPSIREVGDAFYLKQNASDLGRLGSWPFAVGFTIYFVVVLVVSTTSLVSLSVGVSRWFLREMVSARTPFRILVLFVSNTVLLLGFVAAASLILFALLNIWTWPYLPLFFALSKYSLFAGAGLASAASLGSWFFSAPWLRVVVTLSLSPSIILALVIAVTLLGFPFRGLAHAAVMCVLRWSLVSPKGVFAFLSASSAALVYALTLLIACLALLARWALTLGFAKMISFNFAVLFVLTFIGMLLWSLARARGDGIWPNSFERFASPLFLYLGSLCIIVAGFYVQAILDCLVRPLSVVDVGQAGILVQPALSAIIPGSVAGCVVVFSRLGGASWVKAATRLIFVVAAYDFLLGLCGFASYRDTLISVFFDLVGAPVAALLIFKSHAVLFPSLGSQVGVTAESDSVP